MLLPAPSATTGIALLNAGQPSRTKDDASDNKVGGVYAHVAGEFSATEAAEWQSIMLGLASQMMALRTGTLSSGVFTTTLNTAGVASYVAPAATIGMNPLSCSVTGGVATITNNDGSDNTSTVAVIGS
ncbi:MAG: hypothetical protein ABSE73_11810 [Planctomycetota bacterium]